MQGSGLSVARWFTAATLIMSSEGRVAPRMLASELGVSYKTALRIKKRVQTAASGGSSDASLLERLWRVAADDAETRSDSLPARDRSSRARENIRAAACRAFAARGPSATRISDIAQEAGVSSAIIHYYYKSKDEVLLAALQWANEHTSRRLVELSEETSDPVELLRLTLEMAVPSEGVLRDEYLLWIETWARVRLHPELLAECVTMSARWTGFLEQVVEDGRRAGAFHPVAPAPELAQRLVALSDGLAYRSAIGYTGMHVQRVSELLQAFAAEQVGIPVEELAGR
jgi:AcrR family transcriptional regulator